MGELSTFQLVFLTLIISWLAAVVLIWIRFDDLIHGKYLLVSILLWPLILVDEWLKFSGLAIDYPYLIGLFQFVPAVIAALMALAIQKITLAKANPSVALYMVPAMIMLLAQIPIMMLSPTDKLEFLYQSPLGEFFVNWPLYAPFLISGFILLMYAVQSAEQINHYHYYLSDQVVDVDLFRFNVLGGVQVGFMLCSVCLILIMGLVAFDLFFLAEWQTIINLIQAGCLMLIQLVLLEKRHFSPTPFSAGELEGRQYSDDYLRLVLKKSEKAIIRHKAYKHIGLRIKHVAEASEVEPAALAQATRMVLNRNFRAFIYHYRLEYAKKVLMRTDAKVTSVARRLGFNSEKYLSNVFIKYIRLMGKEDIDNTKFGQ